MFLLVLLKRRGFTSHNLFFKYLPDETINSENLNGHASVTSEEVKVRIESPETQLEEQDQASRPVNTEDKTGNSGTVYCFFFFSFFID